MTNQPIDAIIFDYGGVLMRTADPTSRRELERHFDLARGEAGDLVFRSPRWDDVQHGHIDSDTFWEDIGRRLDLDHEQLKAFRRRFWSGDRLDHDLVDLIRSLRDQGYQTALLSNAPADLRAYLEELGIVDAFDVIVISGEEGLVKPAPQMYQRTLERLGVAPREAVFVDDMRSNVEAARRVGLHATRFRGLAPLRVWLRDLGVPVPDPDRQPVPDLQAVIFDWGGVMEELPQEKDVVAWERRLALQAGALPEILWGETWRRLEVGAITDDEYVRRVAERLGLPGRDAGHRFLQAFYTSDRLNLQVVDAARALRDGYQVAILSNAFPTQREMILEHHAIDVGAEFDVYVNSASVGVSKPDPDIFHLTLERLGVAPPQAIFIDDNLRNVDAAREIGLHAIQFVDPETSLSAVDDLLGHTIE
ncbi:MAG: HAD family phosphatase [Chloroflexota bacterium]|nr:HAD family phosphatase [Chloroflexota bacterium]